jgi:SAM-dependent methyltransferase
MNDASQLGSQIVALGPWHLDVQIRNGLSTRAFLDAPKVAHQDQGYVSFISPRDGFRRQLLRLFPRGLEGRSFLDCACNCGGYSFWAKELGAGRCFGFDVREHWIRQARFLLAHREGPKEDVRFEACDLTDLSKLGLEPFDVTLFKGILYHLPDPVWGLKAAADLTKEVIIVNTAIRNGFPDGMLSMDDESPAPIMHGVHGLNWYPTGPKVVERILRWLGFASVRCVSLTSDGGAGTPDIGRAELIGARREGLLEAFSDLTDGPE